MIELHHAPSTAAMAPHILLTEIGAPFVLRSVDTAAQAHRSPAYLALNPNGRVPVLVDGDLVLYESAAICLHLVDRHPQAALAPPSGSDGSSPERPSSSMTLRCAGFRPSTGRSVRGGCAPSR